MIGRIGLGNSFNYQNSYTNNFQSRQNNNVSFGNKFDKLCKKFADPKQSRNLTGEDAFNVLKKLAYNLETTGSSHNVWRKKGHNPVNIATHNPKQKLKPYQQQMVLDAIKGEGIKV